MKREMKVVQKVRSRIKGLAALLLAWLFVLSPMVSLAEVESYYFVAYRTETPILVSGEDRLASGVYLPLDDNQYLETGSGGLYIKSSLTSIGYIYPSFLERPCPDLTTAEDNSKVYCGEIVPDSNYNYSNTVIWTINLDGTPMATSSGVGSSNAGSFTLPLQGTYSITASETFLENYSDVMFLTVNLTTVVDAITINPPSQDVMVGSSVTLDVNPHSSKPKLAWESSDTSVAKVDQTGKVTGVKAGQCTITATYNNNSDITSSCAVTVKSQAQIKKLPDANNRIKNGQEEPLLIDNGSTEDGTLYYILGDNNTTAPDADQNWTTTIPAEKETGKYYVWVKVKGNALHTDSAPRCVTSKIYFPVKFQVVSGKWNDQTSEDKTIELSRYDGEDLALPLYEVDFPAVGDEPDADYKAGSWNTDPSDYANGKNITSAQTFIYTYVEKDPAEVTVFPQKNTLSYNAKNQALVTAGKAENGKMVYALGTDNTTVPGTSAWNEEIPEKADAGTYYVWYKAAGDGDYKDSAAACETVAVSKATVTVRAADQNIHVRDTVPDLTAPVLNTHYTVTGLQGQDALTAAPALEYQKNGSAVTPDSTAAGTYEIVPSGADAGNNYSISYANGTLTVSEKALQTIAAADVTAVYGDTNLSITASVTDPAAGSGKLSYTVSSGDAVTVDADSGALTIVKAGSAVVTVTAAETDTHAKATLDVNVTVNPKSIEVPTAAAG